MRFVRRCAVAVTAAALALTAAPPRALAEPRTEIEAKERFGRGIDLYGQGDFGGALAEFKRAYELAPYAVILYNLGLTYAALGRPVEAADTMAKVLDKPGSLSSERVQKAKAVEREQSARIAELTVETSVEGARIDVDGAEVATTPLAKPLRIKGGPHRIGAVLSGYAPSRKEIDVAAGGREKIRLDLVPTDKRLGHIEVRVNTPGASVSLDGAVVGFSPLASTVSVLPGGHEVEAKRDGYRSAHRHIDVGEGSTGEVRLELLDDPEEVRMRGGDLRLAISEGQSVVSVDGAAQPGGASTLRLAPGPHRLRVEHSGFFPVERDVDIPARGAVDARVVLEPTVDGLAAYVSKNRTLRTFGLIGIGAGIAVTATGATVAGVYLSKKSQATKNVADLPSKKIDGVACGKPGGDQKKVVECPQLLQEYQDTFSRAQTMTIVGWSIAGIGVAGIGAGIVVRALSNDPHRYDKKRTEVLGTVVSPNVSFGPDGGTFGLSGTF